MTQDAFEIRTKENIKIGDVGVCDGELVLVVKHGRHYGIMRIEDFVQQILGDSIDFILVVKGDIDQRIEIVQTRREIIQLP